MAQRAFVQHFTLGIGGSTGVKLDVVFSVVGTNQPQVGIGYATAEVSFGILETGVGLMDAVINAVVGEATSLGYASVVSSYVYCPQLSRGLL